MNSAMAGIYMASLEILLPSSSAVVPNHLIATGGKRPEADQRALLRYSAAYVQGLMLVLPLALSLL